MPFNRLIEIRYGKTVVGGSSSNKLHGNIVHAKSFTTHTVSFTFILAASSHADLAAQMRKVEDGFRMPEQDLSIRQGGDTIVDLKGNHQSGSGARPVITRPDDIKWSGLCRRYDVTISYNLQADNTPDTEEWPNGLIEKNDTVIYSPSGLATITISGTFTSLAGKASSDVYDEKSQAVFDAVKSFYTGRTFDTNPLSEDLDSNNTDDRTTFTVVFKELIFDQSGTVTNHDDPDIVNDVINFTTSQAQPGNDRRAQRFTEVSVSYVASVKKNVTDLHAKEVALKSWLVTKVQTQSGVLAEALLDYKFDSNVSDNEISISFTMLGYPGAVTGSAPLTMTVETERKIDDGNILIGVLDGDPLSRYAFQGLATEIVSSTVQGRFRGTVGDADQYLSKPTVAPFKRLNYSNSSTPLVVGIGNEQVAVSDVRTTAAWQIFHAANLPVITPGSSGGSATTPSGGAPGNPIR